MNGKQSEDVPNSLYFNERYLNNELQCMFSELNIEISYLEVVKASDELNLGKSAGPDYVLNEFFKYGSKNDMITNGNVILFNKLFSKGYFPNVWTEGFIIPLHKKGDVNEVGNYRGITLLSTFGKLFSKNLNNRLCKWAEKYNVYIESQAGLGNTWGQLIIFLF